MTNALKNYNRLRNSNTFEAVKRFYIQRVRCWRPPDIAQYMNEWIQRLLLSVTSSNLHQNRRKTCRIWTQHKNNLYKSWFEPNKNGTKIFYSNMHVPCHGVFQVLHVFPAFQRSSISQINHLTFSLTSFMCPTLRVEKLLEVL